MIFSSPDTFTYRLLKAVSCKYHVANLYCAGDFWAHAISSYGIAWIADKSGWNLVILFWTIAALCGTLLCLMGIKPWKKFVRKCM